LLLDLIKAFGLLEILPYFTMLLISLLTAMKISIPGREAHKTGK